MANTPEVWLRGSVDGFDPMVMPVVHSLLQAREEIAELVRTVPPALVWETPGGAASVGFHVRHLAGALDRLFTYARGEQLSDEQKLAMRAESSSGDPLERVAAEADVLIERALTQLRGLERDDLLLPRTVGRAALPSNTIGLIFHAAEHCTRHAGQAISTAKILKNMR